MKMLKRPLFILIIMLTLLGLSACSTSIDPLETVATAVPAIEQPIVENGRFDGITIRLLTMDGPQIAEPLIRRAPDFEALTGADVEIEAIPFDELYDTMWRDMSTGQNTYHAYVYGAQWSVDYILANYLEELTPRIEADKAIQWDDIAPFYRDFSATYQGRIYTIPLDGDFQMVYYRADLLENAGLQPPDTWEAYLDVARTLHGQDFDGDGEPDYGSCIAKTAGAQSHWMFWSIAASYLQSHGTRQGAFFNTETMEPLVNNDAFAQALEIYKETTLYGPPDELSLDVGDTRSLFVSGRCALSIDWGDIGTLAIEPDSQVADTFGAVILPGSTQVLNRETMELTDCDRTLCPYALGDVNHAPFAAFGGWSGGVNTAVAEAEKEAAYAFLSYMSQPAQANVDVTIGETGFNPYRISQFNNRDLWMVAGMSETAVARYLGAIGVSLHNSNMALDLRVPQNVRYQHDILDVALTQYLAGKITTDEAMLQIYDGWNIITLELGRKKQLTVYRASLGLIGTANE